MLQYTSTHIVNQANTVEYVQAKTRPDGRVISKPKFRLRYGPDLYAENIKAVYVNRASEAELAEAEVDLAGCTTSLEADKTYRIAVYIRVQGDNPSTYANDWVYKGKPLYLGEFDGNVSGTETIAQKVANQVKTSQVVLYGTELIDVFPDPDDANGTKLIIKAKTQFLRFFKLGPLANNSVELQKLNKFAAGVTDTRSDAEWVPVTGAVTIKCVGKEAFGDFTHLVKDLRLPSGPNTLWYGRAIGDWTQGDATANDDRPIPNKMYSLFTIVYESDRGLGNADVLGGVGTSRTTHVFYVADTAADGVDADGAEAGASGTAAAAFKTALTNALTAAGRSAADINNIFKYVVVETSKL